MDKKTSLLYAQLKPYKALVNKTSGFIRWALTKVDKPYVGCSFGKDSSVMLHIVLKLVPDIKVKCYVGKEYQILDNYEEVFKWWQDNYNIDLDVIHFDQETMFEINRMRDLTSELTGLFDSYFVGLRIEESKPREMTLKKHGMFFTKKNGMTRISPMADWKENDIAAYLLSNNIKILDTYDKLGFDRRTGTWLPNATVNTLRSAIANVKQKSTTDFNKLLEMYPDINNIYFP